MALFAAGCDVEEDDTAEEAGEGTNGEGTPEPLGNAHQDFTGAGAWTLIENGSTGSQSLGSATGSASFLMSVAGDLLGGSYVQVRDFMGSSFVQAQSANGNLLVTGGIAAPATTTIPMTFYHNDSYTTSQPAVLLSSTAGNTRCYLTSIFNTSYNSWGSWNAVNDQVRIIQSGSNWYLGGGGKVAGSARCATVTAHLGSYGAVGPTTISLGGNVAGKVCWLTGISGRFRFGGTTDGAIISYNPGLLQWELTVSAGKTANAECNI